MKLQRSPFDIPHEDECPDCQGRGYPPATAQIVRTINGAPTTTELGYGCLRCLGVGRLSADAAFGT